MMHKPPKVWAEWRLNWLPILRSSGWLFVPHRGACAVCLSVDTCNQEHSLISSSRQHTTSLQFFVFIIFPHLHWLIPPWPPRLHSASHREGFSPWCLGRQPYDPGPHSRALLCSLPLSLCWVSGSLRAQTKNSQCTTSTKYFSGPNMILNTFCPQSPLLMWQNSRCEVTIHHFRVRKPRHEGRDHQGLP